MSWNVIRLYDTELVFILTFIYRGFSCANNSTLSKPVILGNVYRPPFENNNHIIELFVEQFSPVIHSINDINLQAIVAGDFNIDLLKIQEREIYGEFLDIMCTNKLYPKITFPTRFARKSCSLIDQIYCRIHSPNIVVSTVVVKSHISDHCPCILSINIFQSKTQKPKYVAIRKYWQQVVLWSQQFIWHPIWHPRWC